MLGSIDWLLVSTAALAVVAGLALGREYWRHWETRKAADAEISVLAYRLRRQLLSWLALAAPEDPLKSVYWARNVSALHFAGAEPRAAEIATLAPRSSRRTANVGSEVLRLFYAGMENMIELTAIEINKEYFPASGTTTFHLDEAAARQLAQSSHSDFEACVEILTRLLESGILGESAPVTTANAHLVAQFPRWGLSLLASLRPARLLRKRKLKSGK